MSLPSSVFYENTLGGTRPRRHIAPQIRTAGLVCNPDCGTVAKLTSNYYSSGRATPELIRMYRRGGEVGRTHCHYGRARDPPPDESFCHGIRTCGCEGARDCLQPTRNVFSCVMDEQLERMYGCSARKPLGRVPTPPYDVPVPRGGFGVCSGTSESVKRIIYGGTDVDILHPAGERKDRGYNWERTGIDPTVHRFGNTRASKDAMSAADVMRHDGLRTTVISKVVKDFQATMTTDVGKPHSYGFDNRKFEENAEKNVAQNLRRGDGNGVREVLSGWAVHPATLKAQDELAARTAASGAEVMGTTTTTDGGHSGGDNGMRVDTVDCSRTMPLSRFSRTFDGQKKGGTGAATELVDDARAIHLLYPSHYVKLGVKSEYFAGGRTLGDTQRLCNKLGFGLNDNQINEVFAAVAVDGKCGIEQFKNKAVEMGYLA